MSFSTLVYIGPELASYGFGNNHPFGPHRMGVFWEEAKRQGLADQVEVFKPVLAKQEMIELFHSKDYVNLVKNRSLTGEGYLDGGDTPAFLGVFEAASYVVGSVVDALKQIMDGNFSRAFVPIAGLHHARTDQAGGFCVFNDVGVAVHMLRKKYNLKRIAYVDIDAHHGDGVFYPFESDPDLIFADLHQDGNTLYPGTGHAFEKGKGPAKGYKLNIPLPPGADDEYFWQVWPAVEQFLRTLQPEFIILQCGADSIIGDPIANLNLSAQVHYKVAGKLTSLAEELGHDRIMGLGGGGYDPHNIAQGWCSVLRALIETSK